MEFANRTYLVTGSARGIGRGIAEWLLARQADVLVGDLDPDDWLASWERAAFVKLDVANEASVRRAVAFALKRFGALHGLVNNAGIPDPENDPVEALDLRDWNRMIATDLTGPFLCAKHAIPALRESGGAIVNIASTRAFQSEPNSEAYGAAKGGLVALTHALAISLGPDVRVNCVAPGWIDVGKERISRKQHRQHPVGRAGEPRDVAGLVGHLLSDASAFMAGETITLDGGMSRRMQYD